MCKGQGTISGIIYLFWNMIHHCLASSKKPLYLPSPYSIGRTRNALLLPACSRDDSYVFLCVRQALHQLNYLPRAMELWVWVFLFGDGQRTLVVTDVPPTLLFSFAISFPQFYQIYFISKIAYISPGIRGQVTYKENLAGWQLPRKLRACFVMTRF